ncbi:response regulator [Rugamonas rubra]|uniref:Virulence sensor protein BvgS n=1 Tax=Rugamonas rubra TaxID=758825 RepID=A0A1I4LHZ0_9BURK|nr:response regulator [Rugamonas rubra]SFL90197.1 Signal transduction histidine kinase [Rugamonas rubra]
MNAYDALPCAVLVTDATGIIEELNAELLDLLGGQAADWCGQRLDAMLPLASQIFLHTHLWPMLMREGRLVELHLQLKGAAGERIPVLLNCRPASHGLAYVWVFFVSQERSRFESELVLARQEAEAANRAKSAFLANMSHEIRTPMNAVLGMLQLMRRVEMDERGRSYAQRAETAARALLRLLDDVLDLSYVESGRLVLNIEEFDLQSLLAELALLLGGSERAESVELLLEVAPDVPARLFGDSLRIQQVLLNLCVNALKFTRSGEVLLTVTRRDARVVFAVVDTGIGIDADQLAVIFEPFTQAESSAARHFGGSGLGLAISKRFVELMGGVLAVDSVRGEGSRFFFDLALLRVRDDSPAGESTNKQQGLARCLLADCHPGARRILNALLAARGYAVAEVENAPALLAACRQQRYELVVVDQGLLSGHESVLEQAYAGWNDEPLTIICTPGAVPFPAHVADALGRRACRTLIKPVLASQLHQVLGELPHIGPGKAAPASDPASPIRRLAGLRVLVVEDNALNQQIAQELLRAEGAVVELVEDGYRALQRLGDSDGFDIVLMDVQMPGMDGYETTRAIRRQRRWRDLPIVAVTANVMANDRDAALESGMNDHVGKPFDMALLAAVIRHHVYGDARPETPDGTNGLADGSALLDYEAAIGRLAGSGALYLRLLGAFSLEAQVFSSALRQALDSHSMPDALRVLHTMKGNAATIGAHTLSRRAAQMEQALRRGEPASGLDVLMWTLDETKIQCLKLSKQLHPADEQVGTGAAEAGSLEAEIVALAELLSASNLAALASFERLQSRLRQQLPLLETKLAAAMSAFDFEQAGEYCRSAAEQISSR